MKLQKKILRLSAMAKAVASSAGEYAHQALERHMDRTGLRLSVSVQNIQQNYPTIDDFADNMVTLLGKIEVIEQPLYDFQLYPTAGQTTLTFFQNPIGQGATTASGQTGPKSIVDTNMNLGGQLPAPQAFWVAGIEVWVEPGSVSTAATYTLISPTAYNSTVPASTVQSGMNDVNAIYSTGALQLKVGEKPYFNDAPLYSFPQASRLGFDGLAVGLAQGNVAANATVAAELISGKLNALGLLRTLDPGLGIMTSQNFNVQLLWPAAQTTPSGFNARIGVKLKGWLFRAAQ